MLPRQRNNGTSWSQHLYLNIRQKKKSDYAFSKGSGGVEWVWGVGVLGGLRKSSSGSSALLSTGSRRRPHPPFLTSSLHLLLSAHHLFSACRWPGEMSARPGFYRQELNKTVWEVPERYQNLTPVGSGAYGSVWWVFVCAGRCRAGGGARLHGQTIYRTFGHNASFLSNVRRMLLRGLFGVLLLSLLLFV